MQVRGLDHVVFNVSDVERSVRWYRDRLGLEVLRYDEWVAGEVPFPSVRIDETCIIDLFQLDRTGENVNHVALWVEGDTDELLAHDDVEVVRRADALFGAQGVGPAIAILDPDGNQIELKSYDK